VSILAAGTVSSAELKPPESRAPSTPNELQPAAVVATARKLEETSHVPGFREKWREEVPQVPLGVGDLVEARTERKHNFTAGEPVLTFVLDPEGPAYSSNSE